MQTVVVGVLLGGTAVLTAAWCVVHAVREYRRRQQVDVVVETIEPRRPTVAELRDRYGADQMPRYPVAGRGNGDAA